VQLSIYPVPAAQLQGVAAVLVVRDVTADRQSADVHEAFRSVVSHELRTPITTIFGGAQLFADRTLPDQMREQAANAVVDEAEHLARVADDLVVLAQSDRPLPAIDEPILLQRFVEAVVIGEQRRSERDVLLRLEPNLPAVLARAGYVEQVLRHLVGRAIDGGHRDSAIEIDIRRAGDEVLITVADADAAIVDGTGAEMFELYHEPTRGARDASGANVSLFISKRLVEGMGGRIWAQPRADGSGAELGFALRVAPDEDPDGGADAGGRPDAAS
jgi:K+-sensing histidine kinase KdpD